MLRRGELASVGTELRGDRARRRGAIERGLVGRAAALGVAIGVSLGVLGAPGCAKKHYLMPTPNVYTHPEWNPFEHVPPALQGDEVSVLYITDRAPEKESPPEYGYKRSRSAAFGEAVVRFGKEMSWEELVVASRAASRARKIELTLASTREIARFAKTPPVLLLSDAQMSDQPGSAAPDPAQAEAEAKFLEELRARLAATPRKEVFIYVHGFNNTFEEAVLTTAELWHFLGREGVPVCYTWPAGMGSFRAYQYTLESTQFTIYHFKQALRLIASCPEVERVNILAHSRGTAVTMDAVRELYLEFRATEDVEKSQKFGTAILAAADIDLDVAIARNSAERIGRAVERTALYVSDEDDALGLSSWLFSGGRLGSMDPKIFSKEELEAMRHSERLQIIDARVKHRGGFGHSYFLASPSVSSDVVLLMRFGLEPGAERGRPLDVSKTGLWEVTEGYPGKAYELPAAVRGE